MKRMLLIFCVFIAACSGGDGSSSSGHYGTGLLEDVRTTDFVNKDGLKTDESRLMADCSVLKNPETDACTLGTLPFLASESLTPTKEQIMSRVIVSHKWMANNLDLLLDSMPADMYRLFSAVTVIVIHSDIRPAFFSYRTGAMYIDPWYLWLTADQRDDISTESDYRSSYGDSLSYIPISQYSKDGLYPFGSGNYRSTQQAVFLLSALLFHELAHANDLFPPAEAQLAGGEKLPLEFADENYNTSASVQLNNSYPLTSSLLLDLSAVRYQGEAPTQDLIDTTALEVATAFDPDGANNHYSYSTLFEDTAMLFEETMMKVHYDIDNELAFIVKIDPPLACNTITIEWQDINRVSESQVTQRAELVVDELLPGHSHAGFFTSPPKGTPSLCSSSSTRGSISSNPIREPLYWK